MKSSRLALLCCAIAGLILGGCADDNNPAPVPDGLKISFLRQVDHGCVGTRDTEYDCPGTAYLGSVESVGDTLILTIHFEANCCPEFVENTSVTDGVLHIDVHDTLSACRCNCEFENEFSFLSKERGELAIEFVSWGGRPEYCMSAFDTLVTLPD